MTLALALLQKRRGECPEAVLVLVCHDEVVVECDADRAPDAEAWLEKAMVEGMDAVMNGTDEGPLPIRSGGRYPEVGEKEVSPTFRCRVVKRVGRGRGHIEKGRRRLDVLDEQSRRRKES